MMGNDDVVVRRMLVAILGILLCVQSFSVVAINASNTARKLLQPGVDQKQDTPPATHPSDANNHNHFFYSSNFVAMALPGVFVLGCIFLCPCFFPKKKEDPSSVFQKGFTSADLSSSFDGNSNSEKIPPSPWRYPPPSPSASRHPPPSPSRHAPMSPKFNRFGSIRLTFSQLEKVTRGFSPSFIIGEGGFGTVYKAQLPSGQLTAVKRAKKEHFDSAEFNSEVEILPKIDHRNLVKLLGYVDKGRERLIVTEYVANGTLREHLDGQKGKILDFNQRLEIAIDVAHGLTYLHLYAEKQIIHRDVKSSNILLTESFRAKVADFGFARVGPNDDGGRTHISTKVKGTVGYLDPEYMKTYQLTTKSDVYSFGILLIEILTGRRPVEPKRPAEERVTVRWAIYNYNEGDVLRLMDPLMEESMNVEILKKMFCLAFQCAAPVRADRPDMKAVGEQLWTIRMEYRNKKKDRL